MKTFKKTFKFICDKCGEFTHTETEYCEVCGTKTLRKATTDDYAKYEKESMRGTKDTRMVIDKAKKDKKAEIKAEKKAKKEAKEAKKEAKKEAEKETE